MPSGCGAVLSHALTERFCSISSYSFFTVFSHLNLLAHPLLNPISSSFLFHPHITLSPSAISHTLSSFIHPLQLSVHHTPPITSLSLHLLFCEMLKPIFLSSLNHLCFVLSFILPFISPVFSKTSLFAPPLLQPLRSLTQEKCFFLKVIVELTS